MNNKLISSIWKFEKRNLKTDYLEHNIFRWFGKLPPQLVSNLINLYSSKNDLILANFAGSGTIPLECLKLERRNIATDVNDLAVLINKIKTNPVSINVNKFFIYLDNFTNENTQNNLISDYEKKWFGSKFNDVIKLKEAIKSYDCNQKEKNLLLVTLMSIIKNVSTVDSRCINHIVFDKNKKQGDVINLFKENLIKVNNIQTKFTKSQDQNLKSKISIEKKDARNLDTLDDNSIDLIISHPPYLGNVDYTNIYQLENYILGSIYGDIRSKDLSTTSLNKYLTGMYTVIDEMIRVCKKNKYMCIIIGDNRKNGNIIPTFSYFISYFNNKNIPLKDIFIWELNQKAGMNIKRHGNHIDHNYILVYKKN